MSNFVGRGWYQRTRALQYLRNNTELITEGSNKSVVFFGDDDNSYDIRLFNNYIRNVKKVGIWAVGKYLFDLPKLMILNKFNRNVRTLQLNDKWHDK